MKSLLTFPEGLRVFNARNPFFLSNLEKVTRMYEIIGFPVTFYSCSDVVECLSSLTPKTRHLFECSWIAYKGHPLFMILVEPDGKSFGLKLIPFR